MSEASPVVAADHASVRTVDGKIVVEHLRMPGGERTVEEWATFRFTDPIAVRDLAVVPADGRRIGACLGVAFGAGVELRTVSDAVAFGPGEPFMVEELAAVTATGASGSRLVLVGLEDQQCVDTDCDWHVVRLRAGRSGSTRFEDLQLSGPQPVAELTLLETPPSYGQPDVWHHSPYRAFAVFLQGQLETEVGDGEQRRFGPGDLLLLEDVDGDGHRSWPLPGGSQRMWLVATREETT